MNTFSVDSYGALEPIYDTDRDPRGIIWMWEPPKKDAFYILGADPTVGITGWTREFRTKDDYKVDNGVIEVVRLGVGGAADVQVAEYAAPVDAADLASYCNLLGRLYSGIGDDEQALMVVEVYPGPGNMTQDRLINQFEYTNLYVGRNTLSSGPQTAVGWVASPKSVRDLWIQSSRHIHQDKILLNSPWLVEEFSYAEVDVKKMTAKAVHGKHDDRIRALMLAIWAGHDWDIISDLRTEAPKPQAKGRDWQASDCSVEQMYDEWEQLTDEWGESDNDF